MIFIPQNIWENNIQCTFRRLKAKTYAAGRESNIELLILVSDIMVNSMLKYSKVFLWNVRQECLNKDEKKKK